MLFCGPDLSHTAGPALYLGSYPRVPPGRARSPEQKELGDNSSICRTSSRKNRRETQWVLPEESKGSHKGTISFNHLPFPPKDTNFTHVAGVKTAFSLSFPPRCVFSLKANSSSSSLLTGEKREPMDFVYLPHFWLLASKKFWGRDFIYSEKMTFTK